jgi:hypothetical protein
VSDFAEIAAVSLAARSYIPAHLLEAYDRMTQAALRHVVVVEAKKVIDVVSPDDDDYVDLRPLASVTRLDSYSRNVNGAA